MTRIRIQVFREPPRGPVKKIAESVVDEADVHDELRDLLHAAGVERPELSILEGGPVFDGGVVNRISWHIQEVDE